MLNLVRNENMKLSRHISTWIMVGILILIVLAASLLIKFNTNETQNGNWKQTLTEQNDSYKKSIATPGVPKVTIDAINQEIKTNEYRIQHNIPPVNSNSLWGFVDGASGVISLISLFAIIMGGGIVANEFSSGTVKLLMIRPSKRWKILTSKYITVLAYTLFMLIILFVSSFLLGGILFGFTGVTTPYLKVSNGNFTEVNMVSHIMGVYGLKCINLIMMVTLAFMISSLFRNSSLAIGIGVFLLFAGSMLVSVLQELNVNWVKYILFANTDLSQYITGKPLVAGMTMTFSIVVILIYYVVFCALTYLGFVKRDVAA